MLWFWRYQLLNQLSTNQAYVHFITVNPSRKKICLYARWWLGKNHLKSKLGRNIKYTYKIMLNNVIQVKLPGWRLFPLIPTPKLVCICRTIGALFFQKKVTKLRCIFYSEVYPKSLSVNDINSMRIRL